MLTGCLALCLLLYGALGALDVAERESRRAAGIQQNHAWSCHSFQELCLRQQPLPASRRHIDHGILECFVVDLRIRLGLTPPCIEGSGQRSVR